MSSSFESLMTPTEVAEYLRKSKSWVYGAASRGELPTKRIGRDLRFSREELDRWLASKTTRAPAATLKAGG